MAAAPLAAAGAVVSIALACTACGGASRHSATASQSGAGAGVRQAVSHAASPPLGRFLAVDASERTVDVTLIAAYSDANSGFNFDGYSRELMWTVPRGWKVRVLCENRGPLRHSCAVVHGAGSTTPAFRGAATPQPQIGLEAGHTARFTFRAGKVGVYRFVCLVPGHESARMWDVLQIVRRGEPSVVDLRAK